MDATTTLLSEDLQELQLDGRPITKALKTTEELEKLTVDPHLSDIERAVYLLSSGQEVQRISVITNLADLLQNNHAECMRRVVPKVREVLHVAQTEMQLEATSAFLQILAKDMIPVQSYASTFLQTILCSVDSKDPEVAGAWLDTLLDVIDLLPKDVIKSDVLTIAVAKGQLSQSVQARLSCSKILGKISTKFEPFTIKKDILPVVQSLCQDVDYEVRGCMCQQLDAVARGLGLEATKSSLLPELVELTNDEESYVRITGLETVVSILSLLDDDTCMTTIIPLVTKFCQQAMDSGDATLPALSKQLGRLCHGLSINLTDEQKRFFIDFYKKLCRVGLADKKKSPGDGDKDSPSKPVMIPDLFEEDQYLECRTNCAYNFPAMVLFIGSRSFKSELFTTFNNLCRDPHVQVKTTMAKGIHEVAKQLGTSVNFIQGEMVNFLKDDCIEVLQALMYHLPETLEVIAKAGTSCITDAKINSMNDIISAVLAADTVIFSSNNWRSQEELMTSLSCLPMCCSNDVLTTKVVPDVFQKLFTARALPVRHSAAWTLLVLVRHVKKQEYREEIMTHIVEEFCHGKSCHHRSLFIDICRFAMKLYSKAYFKEHFYENVLELTSDPVANIRLRSCGILPSLKRLVKLPYDRNLLQGLEACVRRILINEKDRDVNAAIKVAVEELDKIHVQMESVLSRRKNFEDDIEDQLKEDHEKQLLEQEEKDQREEEARLAKGERRRKESKIPGPKKSGGTPVKGSKTTLPAGKSGVLKVPSSTGNAGGRKFSSGNLPLSSVAARRGSLSSAGSVDSGTKLPATKFRGGTNASVSGAGGARKTSNAK